MCDWILLMNRWCFVINRWNWLCELRSDVFISFDSSTIWYVMFWSCWMSKLGIWGCLGGRNKWFSYEQRADFVNFEKIITFDSGVRLTRRWDRWKAKNILFTMIITLIAVDNYFFNWKTQFLMFWYDWVSASVFAITCKIVLFHVYNCMFDEIKML